VGPRARLDVLVKRKTLAFAGIETLDHPAHGLVTTLAELSWLSQNLNK